MRCEGAMPKTKVPVKMHRLVLSSLLLSLTCTVIYGEGHLIDGIFTEPTLEPGYNLVATVPRGAVALNVTELRNTKNYLAIRLQNGSYLLNGNYSINWSGEYKAAGTTFHYHQQGPQSLEGFSAPGPLHEPVDVMVLYQEPNPGIVYRYVIPGSANAPSPHLGQNAVLSRPVEPGPSSTSYRKAEGTSSTIGDGTPALYVPRRYKKKKFAWKPAGYTDCNKSCGGGIQTLRYACIREHTQVQVPEKRCHAIEKPREVQLWCNARPCPPRWRAGAWSSCSVSCGSGVRTRELECVQEVRSTLMMTVPDGACMDPSDLPTSEVCNVVACEEETRTTEPSPLAGPPPSPPQVASSSSSRWNIGPWTQCSTSCGPGRKTRIVTCSSREYSCEILEKPSSQETCDLGPCSTARSSIASNASPAKLQSAQWFFTEWPEQCSAECGVGAQTRRVACERSPEEELCDETSRPETSRACSSNRTCSGQWFTGPWSECSSSCDSGEQAREAVCITTLRGYLRVVLDMNCPASKPETKRPCRGPPCSSAWFTSDWTECSRSCGKGIQKREVKCLLGDGRPAEHHQHHCGENDRPMSRRICNDYPCRDEPRGSNNNPHRALQVQNDPEISNRLEENPLCRDNIPNCHLVIQARLCAYQFYQQSCCLSCSRAKQELE